MGKVGDVIIFANREWTNDLYRGKKFVIGYIEEDMYFHFDENSGEGWSYEYIAYQGDYYLVESTDV